MWSKLRISPKFILKHINELQILHNVKIVFCGDAANAEKEALAIMRKIYEYFTDNQKQIFDDAWLGLE